MRVFDVILSNECGAPIIYDVAAESPREAVIEAWRRYRDLPYVDNEWPQAWTTPRVGRALDRTDGEKPAYLASGAVTFADHVAPYDVMTHAFDVGARKLRSCTVVAHGVGKDLGTMRFVDGSWTAFDLGGQPSTLAAMGVNDPDGALAIMNETTSTATLLNALNDRSAPCYGYYLR